MKKKSLLLAIAAMSMAAVGVGTVGTFAWFSATQNTPTVAAGATGSITASASNANLGQWEITVTPHVDNANIVLSKDQVDGATFVYVDAQNPEVAATKPASAVWAAEVSFTAKIDYTGDVAFSSAAAAQAAFATAIGDKKVTVDVDESGDASSLIRYVSGNTGTGDMATLANGDKVEITNTELLALTIKNESPYKTGVESSTLTNKVYVALTGNNTNQDSLLNDTATLSLTLKVE